MSRFVSFVIASALLILGTGGPPCRSARADTPGRPAPEISGDRWLNSPPLRLADLRGQVVLVEFWTFACWNCQHVEPRMKQWHATYRDRGLRVIGVHTPELAIEKDPANVERYVREHGITYPVAIDTDFVTWNRYGNEAWPALYLIDRRGQIRYVRVGEGAYEETERQIDALLREAPADAPN